MATLKDVIAYLCARYPHKNELSNARVTKMVYLSDWHHAINHDRQITDIEWRFDQFGPWVPNVVDTAKNYPHLFSISATENMYGTRKTLLELKPDTITLSLGKTEVNSLDHTIEVTQRLTWAEFINLVYSTYPIMNSTRGDLLDLVEFAGEYRPYREQLRDRIESTDNA